MRYVALCAAAAWTFGSRNDSVKETGFAYNAKAVVFSSN